MKFRKFKFIMFAVVLALICSVWAYVEESFYGINSNGKRYSLQLKNGIYFCPVIKKPYNGKVVHSPCGIDCGIYYGNMKNGKLHGESKSFFYDYENKLESKKIESVTSYKDGKPLESKTFYESGKLASMTFYKDGKPIEEKVFYENGKLLRSMIFSEDGIREWKEYYENGNLKSTESYKDNNIKVPSPAAKQKLW